MNNWDRVYNDLRIRCWIIFLVMASAGYFFTSHTFALGIILGGLMVIINFSFMQSTIISAFSKGPVSKKKKVLLIAKSFLRLFILGGIIYALMKYNWTDPIGLAIGLSIVFFGIVSLGLSNAWKTRAWRLL
jgi:hypothetical protein